jgi:hypothetical protein
MRDLAALAAYVAGREAVPFAWGTNDCVTFAAGAVLALTGRDPLAGIGTWKTERGALLQLRRRGGLIAAVSSVLLPIPLAHAHRGDICAVPGPDGTFLMVAEGITLVGPELAGLKRLPRTAMVNAWSATA